MDHEAKKSAPCFLAGNRDATKTSTWNLAGKRDANALRKTMHKTDRSSSLGYFDGLTRPGLTMNKLVCMVVLCLNVLVRTGECSDTGYCQVYSYNIKYRSSGLQEKHLFVCCNDGEEKQCEGATYQKPSRSESFCTGEVVQESGSHWTQMETSTFPERGHFYCGGCCGQHIAWEKCTDAYTNAKKNTCLNWVQCFQRECTNIVREILDNHPLKCTLPPPPLPKHYIYVPPRVPANVTRSFRPSRDPSETPAASASVNGSATSPSFTCSASECASLPMEKRCTYRCCEDTCCLPDGPLPYPDGDRLILGLSTIQVVAIAIGSLLGIVALVVGALMVAKRLLPGCKNFKFASPQDAQILVIEGPEDGDTDDEEDENHEVESA